jgi:hypothetical protein
MIGGRGAHYGQIVEQHHKEEYKATTMENNKEGKTS